MGEDPRVNGGLAPNDLARDDQVRGQELDPDVPGEPCGADGPNAEAHAGQTIVAVVHGGVIAHSYKALAGNEVLLGDVHNTSITEWTYRATPWTIAEPTWHLERHNDAAHLEGVV